MTFQSDQIAFEETAAVIRGDRAIDERDAPLVAAASHRFGVRAVNVTRDSFVAGAVTRDRLVVWVRTEAEAEGFRTKRSTPDGRKLRWIAEHAGAQDAVVVVRAFDPEAVEHAMRDLDGDEMTRPLDLPHLWTVDVVSALRTVVVFTHTDEQASQLRDSDDRLLLTAAILDAVRAGDEFGVVTADVVRIVIDSKQTIDEKFDGNLFAYYR